MPSRSALRSATLTAAVLAWPVGFIARAAWGLPTALGAHRRRLRPVVVGSSHFSDGTFHNTLETPALAPANTRDGLLRQWHEERHVGLPGGPIPLATTDFPALGRPTMAIFTALSPSSSAWSLWSGATAISAA